MPPNAFLRVLEPLLEQGDARLHAGMRRLLREGAAGVFVPEAITPQLRVPLERSLLRLISRPLIVELHIARRDGVLHGNTPEARFEDFVEQLGDPVRAADVLRRYPVLAQEAARHIDHWTTTSLAFLSRLCADWEIIARGFNGSNDPGPLVSVEAGLSDRHNRGHSVIRAAFASGLALIYKPRSLALDAHFQELLAWINERGLDPRWRTLAVVDRGDYGWVECVGHASCPDTAAVERFFTRQGAYLALLYALDATDLHHENIVADGEHPMLVDLEALFHPRAIGRPGEAPVTAGIAALAHSVMRVGLLPEPVWPSASGDGLDISGLSAPGGQRSPDPVLQWADAGTDTMHVVRRHVTLPASGNRPHIDGLDANAAAHAGAVVSGFTRAYELLCRYRGQLLADDSPLARFERDEIRVIVRPTRIYARLRDESTHPDLQRSVLERERFFARLWVGVDEHPHLAALVPSEQDDLLNGDIPRFTAQPGSRHLWDSRGLRIGNMLPEPPMASVRRRIGDLSISDLERQRWLITASLTPVNGPWAHGTAPAAPKGWAPRNDTHPSALDLARQTADRLAAAACHGRSEVAWLGLSPRAPGQWSVAPVGLDLYDGLPGIAFFLAHLAAATGDERYRELARVTLATILTRLETDAESRPASAGAFNGVGGLIYMLTHLGVLWAQPDLFVTAGGLLAPLAAAVATDEAYDVIDGSAGAALALLALDTWAPSAWTSGALAACGDRLLAGAVRVEGGLGWPSVRAPEPLAGMAHGNAGIALALLRLSQATGAAAFASAAGGALAYERGLYSVEAGNWPDLRPREARSALRFMTAWCHGAPGIGLARRRSRPLARDPHMSREIDLAIGAVLDYGAVRSQCLCHGELGNLELLLDAAGDAPDHPRARALASRADALIAALAQDAPICGSPGQVETPGLMTGLAGIGYGLLRLSDRHRFPSVLALDPPCAFAPRSPLPVMARAHTRS